MVEMRASSSIMMLRSSQVVHEQVQRRTAFLLWFLIEEHDFINYILLLMNIDLHYILRWVIYHMELQYVLNTAVCLLR